MASAMSSRKSMFIKSVENFTRTLNVVKLLCNALLVRHDIKCTGLLAHLLCYNNKVNYVYVLKSSQDHELYIGSTNNLKRRLRDHNDKKNFSTSWRGPFELVYYEAYKNEKDARWREQALKLRGNARRFLKERIKRSLG